MADDVLDELAESLENIPLEDLAKSQIAIERNLLLLARAAVTAHQRYRKQISDAVNKKLDWVGARRKRIIAERDESIRAGMKLPPEKTFLAHVEDDETLKKMERASELAGGMRDATLEELRTLRVQVSAFQSLLADLRSMVGAP